ncbi:unnamed protein product [Pedinophyceae sp. YPF-701]|nr:unnamed protein product [Pedinophyceae sp. YPF-701]
MPWAKKTAAAAALALLVGPASAASVPALRGVPPERAQAFDPAVGDFECFDKSMKIARSRVQDNYCDCPDGSDEPGTAACPNGTFYCRNLGHGPRRLASAMVDDGVCDCCDGTDEPRGACRPTCLEKGEQAYQAIKAKVDIGRQGVAMRASRIAKAAGARKHMLAERDRLVRTLADLEKKVHARQAQLKEAERAFEAWKAAGGVPVAEQERAEGAAGDETPEAPDADIKEEDLDPDEIGRRIAARWTHDEESLKHHDTPPAATDDAAGDAEAPDGTGVDEPSLKDKIFASVRRGLGLKAAEPVAEGEHAAGPPGAGAEEAAVASARETLAHVEAEAQEVRGRLEELRGNVDRRFGPDDEYIALVDGECPSAQADKYTYRVCPFGEARQHEGAAHASPGVLLGTFSGWEGSVPEEGPRGEATMLFRGGEQCWGGPQRSMTVRIECALEDALQAVDEPSRCEYTAVLKTPSACVPWAIAEMEAELHDLEQQREMALAHEREHTEL